VLLLLLVVLVELIWQSMVLVVVMKQVRQGGGRGCGPLPLGWGREFRRFGRRT